MKFTEIDELIGQFEKYNINLEPEVLGTDAARALLSRYAKIKKLASYGEAMLAARLDDATAVAKEGGVSVGQAKATVDTGKSLKGADEVREAFKSGELSVDQATEIAKAEHASPGSSSELLKAAPEDSFQTLREKSRKIVLEAEQHRGLAKRQREARRARSFKDDLGMISINLLLEPQVGAPIVNRAEVEAGRLFRAAKRDGLHEPFERHLADAYASLLSSSGSTIKGPKPELVVLVSHGITQRGGRRFKRAKCARSPGSAQYLPRGRERSPPTPF